MDLSAACDVVTTSATGLRFAVVEDRPLLQQFNALWNDRRYTRRVRPKETVCLREACARFYKEANAILATVAGDELPVGVTRNPEGMINGGDIVRHVDALREILATK